MPPAPAPAAAAAPTAPWQHLLPPSRRRLMPPAAATLPATGLRRVPGWPRRLPLRWWFHLLLAPPQLRVGPLLPLPCLLAQDRDPAGPERPWRCRRRRRSSPWLHHLAQPQCLQRHPRPPSRLPPLTPQSPWPLLPQPTQRPQRLEPWAMSIPGCQERLAATSAAVPGTPPAAAPRRRPPQAATAAAAGCAARATPVQLQ